MLDNGLPTYILPLPEKHSETRSDIVTTDKPIGTDIPTTKDPFITVESLRDSPNHTTETNSLSDDIEKKRI